MAIHETPADQAATTYNKLYVHHDNKELIKSAHLKIEFIAIRSAFSVHFHLQFFSS